MAAQDLPRIPPTDSARLVEIPHRRRKRLECAVEPRPTDVDRVGVPRHHPTHARSVTADPHTGTWLLQGLRRARRVLDAEVLSGIRCALFGPHPPADLDSVDHLADAHFRRRELIAVGAVFELLPSRSDAELEPAARHHVDTCRDLGQQRGIPVGDRCHHRSESERGRVLREPRKKCPRFEAIGGRRVRAQKEVIRDPQSGEAVRLSVTRDLHHVVEAEAERRLDLNAELHGAKRIRSRSIYFALT